MNEHLWVQGEPTLSELYMAKERMLYDPMFISSFKNVQTLDIVSCDNWISLHTIEAISCFKRRKDFLTIEKKDREPLSYSRFITTLDHVQKYLD